MFSRFLVIKFFLLVLPFSAVYAAPLSFVDAIALTLNQNDDLLAKKAQLEADKEQVNQAWSYLKPNLTAQHSTGVAKYSINGASNLDANFNRTSLSVTQSLFSQKKWQGIQRAEQVVMTAETVFKSDQERKLLEVVDIYLQLSQYMEISRLAKLALVDHVTKLDRLKAMLKRGLATKMDLLEAQARHDELRADLIQNENKVTVRLKNLEHLIGKTVDEVEPISTELIKYSEVIVANDSWHKLAWLKSSFVKVAQEQLSLASKDVDIAKSDYWPEVNLRGDLIKSDSYETSIKDQTKVQLEIVLPLYQGGLRSSRAAAAKKIVQSRGLQVSDQKRFVKAKLDEVVSSLKGSLANIEAMRQSISSNEAYLESAEKGLSYGVRGVFDVLNAKSRLYDAERQLTIELYSNILSQFEFLFLLGDFNQSSIKKFLNGQYSFDRSHH